MLNKQGIVKYVSIFGFLTGIAFLGLNIGTFDFSPSEVFMILIGEEIPDHSVIFNLRLPRVLQAMLAGSILTLGGFFMQVVIKNPLADPYIMGMSAGAGLGVNIAIISGISLIHAQFFSIPIFAAIGAFFSLLLVLVLGNQALKEDNSKLLIAGVAVASVLTAITGLLIYRFNTTDQLAQLVYWTFGSFNRASWGSVRISFILAIMALIGGWLLGTRMDILALGDSQAESLGMHTIKLKILILILCSLCVGGLVAFTGPIGFVGMMVPHFARSFFGAMHRKNMLLSFMLGAGFMESCDILSRLLAPPAGLPIGIITSLLGVPFFLYLLFASKSYL